MTIHEILERILEDTGYVTLLEAERTPEAQARLENIEEFYSVIESFMERSSAVETEQKPGGASSVPGFEMGEAGPGATPLSAFLDSIELVTDLDAWDQGTNVLTLMTLHTAKGLEFPIVYMVGLEEGIFPHVNSYVGPADEVEEERRLCYVGITRAREKLHLSYATERRMYGATHHNLPSRFLNEIPAGLFDSRTLYTPGVYGVGQDEDEDQDAASGHSLHDPDPIIEFDDDTL